MRYTSLDMRRSLRARSSDGVAVLLVTITHPDLAEPLHLSSDATEVISLEPDVVWGTRSNGVDFVHLIRGQTLWGEGGSTQRGQLVLNDLGGALARISFSASAPATVDFAIVRASAPDVIEMELGDILVVGAETGPTTLTLDLAEIDDDEPIPCDRMGKHNFPGLHR